MWHLRKKKMQAGRPRPAVGRRGSYCIIVSVLLLAGCRPDMHNQPRYKPLAKRYFFADLRPAPPPVEGTVARGQLHDDTYFYTGKFGSNPGDYMPFPVTM